MRFSCWVFGASAWTSLCSGLITEHQIIHFSFKYRQKPLKTFQELLDFLLKGKWWFISIVLPLLFLSLLPLLLLSGRRRTHLPARCFQTKSINCSRVIDTFLPVFFSSLLRWLPWLLWSPRLRGRGSWQLCSLNLKWVLVYMDIMHARDHGRAAFIWWKPRGWRPMFSKTPLKVFFCLFFWRRGRFWAWKQERVFNLSVNIWSSTHLNTFQKVIFFITFPRWTHIMYNFNQLSFSPFKCAR